MVKDFGGLAGTVHFQINLVFADAADAVKLCHAVAAADIHTDLVFHDLFQIGRSFAVKLVSGNAGRYGGTGNLNFIQFGSFCGVRIFGMGEACR